VVRRGGTIVLDVPPLTLAVDDLNDDTDVITMSEP
jgi:hypothetical protein